MAWNLYDIYRRNQCRGSSNVVDLTDAVTPIKAAIVTNVYTPDQNLHDFWNDANANEVSGTNYTAGGNALSNFTITLSGAGLVTIDSDDPAQWAQHASGFTNGRRFIVYHDTGTATTSELIAYSDAEAADFGNVSGPVTLQLDAGGIYQSAR